MKKLYFVFAVLGCMSILSSTIEFQPKFSSIVITSLVDAPTLPDEPYDYSVEIPGHLLLDSVPQEGYSTQGGQIDTTLLPLIGNDIATLGRVLFYDKALSANENMSCGSCHLQSSSFADPKPLSQGVSDITKRNSMHLNDLGWSNNADFFWNKQKVGMMEAIKLPLQDENEVGATLDDLLLKLSTSEFYPELFVNAYSNDEVTEQKILNAISHFIISMNTFNSRLDQAAKGLVQLNDLELRGKTVFAISCATCHVQGNRDLSMIFGPNGGDLDLDFEVFLTYNGYIGSSEDKGATEGMDSIPFPLFKMPTLRNIGETGPYMHDGAIPDLDSLINFYSHGVAQDNPSFLIPPDGFQFSKEDKYALKAFLLTLTDEDFLTNDKWADPFKNSTSLHSEDLGADVKIMPNPFDQLATITIEGYENIRKDIRLVSTDGQTVLTDYFTDDLYELQRSRLHTGLYILTVSCQNKVGSYKIMVQ